jgi:ferritin
MVGDKMHDALNKQVNAELYSAYLYLAMSAYFESISLHGFANWMRVQAQEEQTHAMKLYDYIHETNGRATLTAIDAPPNQWSSPLDAFENVLKHEQKVTGLINGLVDLAVAGKDHATNNFLQWFVAEQVEEESSADAIVQKLKLVGDARGAIFMFDQELGTRTFTPPAKE